MGVRVREKVKGSGCFWVFINYQGKRVSRQVGSKAAAKEVAEKIKARLTLGQDAFPEPEPELPTLSEYYGHIKRTYLETATRPKTQDNYEQRFKIHILPKLGSRRLDNISKADVRELISELIKKELAKVSIKMIISSLSAVMNHAIEDELFFVHRGQLQMKFRDRDEIINEGEFIIVPHGVEHCPVAVNGVCEVMLFEPGSTVNTGNASDYRKVTELAHV